MINLMPPGLKEDYDYARRNSALLRIVLGFCVGIGGIVVVAAAGFLYLQQAANAYGDQATQIQDNLRRQNQRKIEADATEVSDRLKLAVQVLSQEVLFSQLLKQLAVVTPKNVNLSSVTISEFGGGIDISADALDYNAATQLQVNLADPKNKIFAKADLVSIACDGEGTKTLPCKASVRALFTVDNPFLFINGKAQGH